MSDEANRTDQDWREQVRVFVIVWGIVFSFAAFLKLGAFAYFTNNDLKKAEAGAAYWQKLANDCQQRTHQ